MSDVRNTIDDDLPLGEDASPEEPGLVVPFSVAAPIWRVISLAKGPFVFGRTDESGAADDERVSREHAEIGWDGVRFSVQDLGSRNGTWVDGRRVTGKLAFDGPTVLRIGATLALFVEDVRPYRAGLSLSADTVAGPALHAALARVAAAAATSPRVLILGESGTGKELAARAFHAAGPNARGRFIAVNCAAIPEGVAERLLFGAVKGSYSGATHDAEGYAQAAHGGVLFLDEMGELDLDVQAKLLRLLESNEVLPLGAATPRKVDVRICFATHRDLRVAAANRTFREDLYYRMAHAIVRLPPLRERVEEIPQLIVRELARIDARLTVHARFVEAALLRAWPGNVRELIAAVRRAAADAQLAGSQQLRAEHLDPDAGRPLQPEASPPVVPSARTGREPTRAEIEAVLTEHEGNMAASARALGLHRTQLYRLVQRLGITPRQG